MKIVKESIQFKRESNPIDALGIGTKQLIEKWLDKMFLQQYVINDDLTIDSDITVNFAYDNIKEFPEYIQFNKVKGNFLVNDCGLLSLRGCPKEVGMSFFCNDNKLTSLEGCPKIVKGNFHCDHNKKSFSVKEVRSLCDVGNSIII